MKKSKKARLWAAAVWHRHKYDVHRERGEADYADFELAEWLAARDIVRIACGSCNVDHRAGTAVYDGECGGELFTIDFSKVPEASWGSASIDAVKTFQRRADLYVDIRKAGAWEDLKRR